MGIFSTATQRQARELRVSAFALLDALKRLLDITKQPDERSQIVDRLKEIKSRAAEYALFEVGYVEDDLERFASPLRSADIHAGSMAAEIRAARGGSAEYLKYLRAVKRP